MDRHYSSGRGGSGGGGGGRGGHRGGHCGDSYRDDRGRSSGGNGGYRDDRGRDGGYRGGSSSGGGGHRDDRDRSRGGNGPPRNDNRGGRDSRPSGGRGGHRGGYGASGGRGAYQHNQSRGPHGGANTHATRNHLFTGVPSDDPAHGYQAYPEIPPHEWSVRYVRMNAATENLRTNKVPLVIPELRVADGEWGDARLDAPGSVPDIPHIGWLPVFQQNPGAPWHMAGVVPTNILPPAVSQINLEKSWPKCLDAAVRHDVPQVHGQFPFPNQHQHQHPHPHPQQQVQQAQVQPLPAAPTPAPTPAPVPALAVAVAAAPALAPIPPPTQPLSPLHDQLHHHLQPSAAAAAAATPELANAIALVAAAMGVALPAPTAMPYADAYGLQRDKAPMPQNRPSSANGGVAVTTQVLAGASPVVNPRKREAEDGGDAASAGASPKKARTRFEDVAKSVPLPQRGKW
ncbi:hypothetical protein H9P43_005485 [Blastocladiella emersonii ATCC 22665]|nr:hypothetical protein H9P43_005485 [Blastocladiella emersonii ATCC 22665]